MGNILVQSVILVCIMALGYILKKVKLFSGYDYRVITNIIMYITLPCVIITNFTSFEWDNSLLLIPVIGFAVSGIVLIISVIMSRSCDDMDKKFYILNTSGYSMGTFAMPFIQNSLGTEGIVAACMFDAGGTFMPSGLNSVAASMALKGEKQKVNPLFVFKRLFTSAPFLTYIFVIILALCSIELPSAVLQFAEKVGDANSFLCMFMIGLMFEMKFQKENVTKVIKVLAIRMAVAVIVALIALYCLPFSLELRKALAIVVFSPIATLDLIFTDKMGGDVELAGFANSISIILSIIVMTVLMGILA